MSRLSFQLFGKFNVRRDARTVEGFSASKEQELLCYLLVRRERSHPRESLASLLWGEVPTEKSKKYLRQALWHLQSKLHSEENNDSQLLVVEHDWVQLNLQSELWLDVAMFEAAFEATQGTAGQHLDEAAITLLKEAVALYRGDLLAGWYQDWCLFERERLQNIYLSMLDKLMSYALEHQEYEVGEAYGSLILRYDRASERTYRQLMQLQYLAGDRTGALRQYERCVAALHEELGVEPERRTIALWEQIRTDGFQKTKPNVAPQTSPSGASVPEVLGRLKKIQWILAAVQKRIERDINAFERRQETMKH